MRGYLEWLIRFLCLHLPELGSTRSRYEPKGSARSRMPKNVHVSDC